MRTDKHDTSKQLMMKLPLLILSFILCELVQCHDAHANTQPVSNTTVKSNQAEALITQPATINSNWDYTPTLNTKSYFTIKDPDCKKINPLDYINNPESFFKSCEDTNNSNRKMYEPVEYLKVPPLESGINIKLGDF
ncbi:hypothetical protein [Anabaena sp. UHCC 0204]|uniref:hypothetical protein n=1 Tax=Anabaena sp. UHCC 0204 TaxID=2590009 RepID=UPI001445B648|nr:hypothetical protein [Anabaena sp. UHCC 0204]MTJ09909.1 hypothetical protein [Anabaena sp. UHCC 0204]